MDFSKKGDAREAPLPFPPPSPGRFCGRIFPMPLSVPTSSCRGGGRKFGLTPRGVGRKRISQSRILPNPLYAALRPLGASLTNLRRRPFPCPLPCQASNWKRDFVPRSLPRRDKAEPWAGLVFLAALYLLELIRGIENGFWEPSPGRRKGGDPHHVPEWSPQETMAPCRSVSEHNLLVHLLPDGRRGMWLRPCGLQQGWPKGPGL